MGNKIQMNDLTLDEMMKPEYWLENQREAMGCGDFCERYFWQVEAAAGKGNARVMESPDGDFWMELLKEDERFIINAAVNPRLGTNSFYVGYLKDCEQSLLKYYNDGVHGRLAELIEKNSRQMASGYV